MKIISLFSGAGGLDLGFERVGFDVIWANEFDKTIWDTYKTNHSGILDTRSISNILPDEIPNSDGIIGGPPCQSWSLAGSMKGIEDSRGKLVYDYVRILEAKRPKFFVFENVPGLISKKHKPEFDKLVNIFEKIGYNVSYKLLNAADYGVPQIRKRVFIIGFRKDLERKFDFEKLRKTDLVTLNDVIRDIENLEENNQLYNHEVFEGSFSYIYMSRNRKKEWDEASFTIQASGRHAPLHPSSSSMKKVEKNKMEFTNEYVRRLSVRECARIQTFPDNFKFIYSKVDAGYKMVGNAVPVKLAEVIANEVYNILGKK